MIITLYENCRLTKAYNEVFNSAYLEGYLNTLTKHTYTLDEDDEVYLSNKGRTNLDAINQGNFICNYMKVEDDVNNITRYFFLDDFEIVNGIAVVDYTEDIWASYSSKINIVKGNVSNLRYGIGSDIKYLPNEYVSNEPLTISSLDVNTGGYYNIILVLQIYNLESGGVPTDRNLINVGIINPDNFTLEDYTFIQAEDLINDIVEYSSIKKSFRTRIVGTQDYNNYCYEVVNAYIIPKAIISDLSITRTQLTYFYRGETTDANNFFATGQQIQDGIYYKNKTLSSNFKRYAIGTLDNFVTLKENGSAIDVKYILTFDNNNFKFNLKVGTSIIDITSSFTYEIPISVQTADATQQQAIARELKNRSLDIQKSETIGKGVTNIVGDVAKMGIGIGAITGGNVIKGASMITEGVTSTINDSIDMAYSLQKNDLNRWYNNYEMYKTSTSINTGSNLQLSVLYGVMELLVNPDNEDYINNLIEVVGYNTLKIVNDNSLLTTKQENKDYNIIRFNSVWMYGNFPHSVQLILEEILTKGFKIWFKSNV